MNEDAKYLFDVNMRIAAEKDKPQHNITKEIFQQFSDECSQSDLVVVAVGSYHLQDKEHAQKCNEWLKELPTKGMQVINIYDCSRGAAQHQSMLHQHLRTGV